MIIHSSILEAAGYGSARDPIKQTSFGAGTIASPPEGLFPYIRVQGTQ